MRDRPIYHITHVDNLPGIVAAGELVSDARRRATGLATTNIGYHHIKERRMKREVAVHPGTTLGEYVPLNFCNRSVMLYVVDCGHLDYAGGQDDVVHLVSSIGRAVDLGQRWAFSDRHADVAYSSFSKDLVDEANVEWQVMGAKYWSETRIKERRQAEFLVHGSFPIGAIETIACSCDATAAKARAAVADLLPEAAILVKPGWYY